MIQKRASLGRLSPIWHAFEPQGFGYRVISGPLVKTCPAQICMMHGAQHLRKIQGLSTNVPFLIELIRRSWCASSTGPKTTLFSNKLHAYVDRSQNKNRGPVLWGSVSLRVLVEPRLCGRGSAYMGCEVQHSSTHRIVTQ